MRGAMVGGMAGGSEGAKKGAKVGVAAGVTRNVAERSADRRGVDSEDQSRAVYESSDEYKNAEHSDFDESPPEVLSASPSDESTKEGGEATIEKDGKPIVEIVFPPNWKQKSGKNSASATSPKGNAWAAIATIDGAKDKEAGLKSIRGQIEKYLDGAEFDELTKTERGALLITGSGKVRKSGIPVVFAIGVFKANPDQLAAAAFVADKNIEDQYKEAVRYMCKTIRGGDELGEQKHEVAKPISKN
jgi:hypothetical protein